MDRNVDDDELDDKIEENPGQDVEGNVLHDAAYAEVRGLIVGVGEIGVRDVLVRREELNTDLKSVYTLGLDGETQ